MISRYLLLVFFAFLICHDSYGQVIISPEIGLSYQPFKVSRTGGHIGSNKTDYLIGLSAQLPIGKKWLIKTRISYSKRESAKWDLCGIAYCFRFNYEHNDLNIDLGLQYKISKLVSIGIGPSIIRKINSVVSETTSIFIPEQPETIFYFSNNYNIGISGFVSFDLKYFIVNLEHMRRLSKEEPLSSLWRESLITKSRTNLTIAVPIFSGRHKK